MKHTVFSPQTQYMAIIHRSFGVYIQACISSAMWPQYTTPQYRTVHLVVVTIGAIRYLCALFVIFNNSFLFIARLCLSSFICFIFITYLMFNISCYFFPSFSLFIFIVLVFFALSYFDSFLAECAI